MKITADRAKLQAAFQLAAMVAPSRSPKPILQNVRLDITPDGATFSATDLEIGIRVAVEGVQSDTKAGSLLFPVGRFGQILRETNDETLTIETSDKGLKIKGARSEFKLPASSPDDFPLVAAFTSHKYHVVGARLLRELVKRTLFATDTESSRYVLGGVCLEFSAGKLTAIGTDGRRLAKMEGPAQSVEGCTDNGVSATIVPSRSMQLIERALANDVSGDANVVVDTNSILIKTDTVTLYSRLVEGRFPKWRDVLPDRRGWTAVSLPVGGLMSAIRQASVVASDESRGIDFAFEEGRVVLSGTTAEVGSSRVEMACDCPPATGVTLTLDHRYVADFLKVLDSDKSAVGYLRDAESPFVLTTDDGYEYVVMPLGGK